MDTTVEAGKEWNPHAFHRNLPPHYMDKDGIPYVTKFAEKKAQQIIKLTHSIQLHESLFVNDNNTNDDGDVDEDEDDDDHRFPTEYNMASVMKKCTRLQSQLSTLEGLKHGGISQVELCRMLLHILRLVAATVTVEYTEPATEADSMIEEHTQHPRLSRRATINYDNVGYVFNEDGQGKEQVYESAETCEQLDRELSEKFALPAPAREALLSVLVSILSKKAHLRSVSNASLYPEGCASENRILLIIHWRALLRMLLRTAPYLDEHKVGNPPTCSNSRQNTIVRRTVILIRRARHFFDQGIRPPGVGNPGPLDGTARDVWNMVKDDVLYHTHTHAAYRGGILLYLFQPTRCTSDFYLDVMPHWMDSWTSIDRCPEFDYLWLVLFCRARKHVHPDQYDWGPLRQRLLTQSQYWLQIPVGGGSMDKSFPHASTPRSRSCPARLKVFVGSGSSYEEGIDFVAKVAKLLVASVGRNGLDGNVDSLPWSMSDGTSDMLRFLSFVAPYFNPSNIGTWTFTLGAFLHYFSYEFCHRVGITASLEALASVRPTLVEALCGAEPNLRRFTIPPREMVALLDALLPLCQQALYSKNGHVGRAGEAAMVFLTQIDPVHITPPFLDFATSALDFAAVNLSHQAPSALSALTRLVQPALRTRPSILLRRLPEILQLSLAGIDSNDQNKSIRTLIFYRNLTSWIPVVGDARQWNIPDGYAKEAEAPNGTARFADNLRDFVAHSTASDEYLDAIRRLPETSLLSQRHDATDESVEDTYALIEQAGAAMGDWVLAFLDRIYDLLRASGDREKSGKNGSHVASRHSSSDVQQARNFSRVLKECLMQVFSAMDEATHATAVRSVAQFLSEETFPFASKDASALCQAVGAARTDDQASPGLDGLIPVLLENIDHNSSKTVVYRLRCLAGSVRYAGRQVLHHREAIMQTINFALSSNDKAIFKTGCKLLRHTLSSQSESYPIASDCMPRNVVNAVDAPIVLGKGTYLGGNAVKWHVPSGDELHFACDLLRIHVIEKINGISENFSSVLPQKNSVSDDESSVEMVDVPSEHQIQPRAEQSRSLDSLTLRRCLRVIRYSLRSCGSIMLDHISNERDQSAAPGRFQTDTTAIPHEQAIQNILQFAPKSVSMSLMNMRGQIGSFTVSLASVIASETVDSEVDILSKSDNGSTIPHQSGNGNQISSDTKICKEISEITLLLLTRRGASFRCQEGKTIWKAQKQLVTDFPLSALADHNASVLQRASLYGDEMHVRYKDGEEGGKSVPRRLLVARVQIFYEWMQRNASFEIPRRLRRLERMMPSSKEKLFTVDKSSIAFRGTFDNGRIPNPLAWYEGLVDGLFALSCHSNTQVRTAGIGVIDYALTRFGWLVRSRVPRLLSAIALEDGEMRGKYGIPSCAQLSKQVDSQGKRKRLAEAMKGVCSILSLPRVIHELMRTESLRFAYVKTLCSTDKLMSLLPVEEMQKMVHYFQSIFNPFRSKFFSIPRATEQDQLGHEQCLGFLLDILTDDSDAPDEQSDNVDGLGDSRAAHWRKRLLVGWFVTNLVDEGDMHLAAKEVRLRLWDVCFGLLQKEMGQPLQRVAVGLLGRLISFITSAVGTDGGSNVDVDPIRDQLQIQSFCQVLGKALVLDHREDTSVGGGHAAQWSAGVDDILRDASRFVAPRSMFPFQRTSQSSGTFKVQHAQMIETSVLIGGDGHALQIAQYFLSFAKDMAAAPPSEDQRNQQCTSAEIFGGVCRALLDPSVSSVCNEPWESLLLPFLDDVVPKIPISLAAAFFDAFRYGIQSSSPSQVFPLTSWIVNKIDETLWKQKDNDEMESRATSENEGADKSIGNPGMDGFATQSKWLYLASAIIVEMDEEKEILLSPAWFNEYLQRSRHLTQSINPVTEYKESWRLVHDELLPRLVNAVGHPYDSCRDHIAGCLFRVWSCEQRIARLSALRDTSTEVGDALAVDVQRSDSGSAILQKFSSVESASDISFKERYNTLITARKFISCCIHLGDAKREFSELVAPLLPLVFEALKVTIDEGANQTENENAAKRALEAEVVKGFRYTIAELGSSCVLAYPGGSGVISRVITVVDIVSNHEVWQVRQAAAHFIRCFQGSHKFLFDKGHSDMTTKIIANLLSDERREVSSAAMAALTGILAATSPDAVKALVEKYAAIADRSRMKQKKKTTVGAKVVSDENAKSEEERRRARNQQNAVFFLCAAILAQPYETPPYVPVALASISKHSFERSAPLNVRDTVKRCCAEFKRTHMSDNWEIHRKAFTQEQLEALEDVVSSPHYYA